MHSGWSTLNNDLDIKSWPDYTAYMISREQCRAARAWLGWGQPQLAIRAKVGLSTVRDFETGKRVPIANNRESIQRAFEASEIRFLFDGETAVGIEVMGPTLSTLIPSQFAQALS